MQQTNEAFFYSSEEMKIKQSSIGIATWTQLQYISWGKHDNKNNNSLKLFVKLKVDTKSSYSEEHLYSISNEQFSVAMRDAGVTHQVIL